MAGPSPLNSACQCCLQPPTTEIDIQYASASQSCINSSCGELPCTSLTEPPYNPSGPCAGIEVTCSPNWADLTRAEKCSAKRYLTVTRVSSTAQPWSGEFVAFGNLGRTTVKQYTIDENNTCTSTTTCSGTVTQTDTYEGESCSGSLSRTYTHENCELGIGFFAACIGSSGTLNADLGFFGWTGVSSYNQNCYPECKQYDGDGNLQGTSGGSLCSGAFCSVTTTYSPPESCSGTITYTNEAQSVCTPKQFPSFPAFVECTPEGEEPPEPPELESGQGYGSEAYKFTNPNNPQIKSEQKVQYRVEHGPTGTCYLKVWFRKKIQQWKYEDCDSGFAGDPPRTLPATINCNENGGSPCYSRWSTDGAPTYQDDGTYEWKGTRYPCYAEDDKVPSACENAIYSTEVKTLTAEENQLVTVEFKYSQIEDYEPNWPDKDCDAPPYTCSQGCKPNGFPIANPEDCPEYNP